MTGSAGRPPRWRSTSGWATSGAGRGVSSIALAGFLSLFPLLLVTIAVLDFVTHGRTDFPDEVIEGLGLTGRAADQVLEAVAEAEPEDAERGGRPDEQPGTPDETVTGRA